MQLSAQPFPKIEADKIIAEAEKNGFDEDFCFAIYEEATRPM